MKRRHSIFSICLILLANGLICQHALGQNNSQGNEVTVIHDLEYKKSNGASSETPSLKLDVYRPATGRKKTPAIIFVHGGGFWEGDKASGLYVKMAAAFAAHGYAAFSVNYTLQKEGFVFTHHVLDGCITEVMAAVQWIRANSERLGVDTAGLLICGDSAGGGIVINTAYDSLYSQYFIGCVDLWGGLPGAQGWDAPVFSGSFPAHTPPTCIIHGTRDRIVPFTVSRELSITLSQKNIYNRLFPLENADHYPVQLAGYFIPLMLEFADKVSERVD